MTVERAAAGATDGGGRVLIAEDEEHLGALVAQYLRSRGLDVMLVRDGGAAIDAVSTGGFDAALVDVRMPTADGFAVLATAQTAPRPPELVLATGNGTRETAVEALRAGAHATVAKPYRMAEVEAVLRRAIEIRRLRDTVEALRTERDILDRALQQQQRSA